jgi:hypothetical protein
MTGTKSKFRSKFWFWLDSWPATGRNFSGIFNLGKNFPLFDFRKSIFDSGCAGALPGCANVYKRPKTDFLWGASGSTSVTNIEIRNRFLEQFHYSCCRARAPPNRWVAQLSNACGILVISGLWRSLDMYVMLGDT